MHDKKDYVIYIWNLKQALDHELVLKPKYEEKAKLCYVDTDSFIVHRKTDDIYKDIAEDVETII